MGAKFILKSRTVWGLILTVLPTLLSLLDVEWTPTDSADLNRAAELVVELVGLVLALWGRFTARHKLTVLPKGDGAANALLLALLLPPLAGCAGLQAAREAETPAQRAYALFGLFEGAQIVALAIVENPETPAAAKLAVQQAEDVAYTAAVALKDAARAYAEAEAEIAAIRAAGLEPTQERLAIATAALQALTKQLAEAEPKIRELKRLVEAFGRAEARAPPARPAVTLLAAAEGA